MSLLGMYQVCLAPAFSNPFCLPQSLHCTFRRHALMLSDLCVRDPNARARVLAERSCSVSHHCDLASVLLPPSQVRYQCTVWLPSSSAFSFSSLSAEVPMPTPSLQVLPQLLHSDIFFDSHNYLIWRVPAMKDVNIHTPTPVNFSIRLTLWAPTVTRPQLPI